MSCRAVVLRVGESAVPHFKKGKKLFASIFLISVKYAVGFRIPELEPCRSVAGTSTRLNNCEGSDVKTKHL